MVLGTRTYVQCQVPPLASLRAVFRVAYGARVNVTVSVSYAGERLPTTTGRDALLIQLTGPPAAPPPPPPAPPWGDDCVGRPRGAYTISLPQIGPTAVFCDGLNYMLILKFKADGGSGGCSLTVSSSERRGAVGSANCLAAPEASTDAGYGCCKLSDPVMNSFTWSARVPACRMRVRPPACH